MTNIEELIDYLVEKNRRSRTFELRMTSAFLDKVTNEAIASGLLERRKDRCPTCGDQEPREPNHIMGVPIIVDDSLAPDDWSLLASMPDEVQAR